MAEWRESHSISTAANHTANPPPPPSLLQILRKRVGKPNLSIFNVKKKLANEGPNIARFILMCLAKHALPSPQLIKRGSGALDNAPLLKGD
nr:hypothetical transcript [Hymenolepis microstoma]